MLTRFLAVFDHNYVKNTTLFKILAMYSYIWDSLYHTDKGSADVIFSKFAFIEWHEQFTSVPLKPLTDFFLADTCLIMLIRPMISDPILFCRKQISYENK